MPEDQQQTPASSAIPLLVPQKKKQAGKPKARIRPTRALKKNGPPKRKLVPTSKKPVAASQVSAIPPNTNKEGPPPVSNDAPQNSSSAVAPVAQPTKSKILPRKQVRKAGRSIRPTKISSGAKKGLSINVGSSMSKVSSIRAGSSRTTSGKLQSQILPQLQRQVATLPEAEQDVESAQNIPSASDALVENENMNPQIANNEAPNNVNRTNEDDEIEIIPYQHMGQIDPALNIPPPKPNEKTMKDYCSKFKIPRSQGNNNEENNNNVTNANAGNIPAEAAGNNDTQNSAGDANTNATGEEPKDNRSGPLVEIINGEIVIKESSMIVGGRQTTEEVDRELDGAVVVEENTGITATYNSFTKRQKTQRWTVEETRKFYHALRQCGTDFSTMESFFDGSDESTKRTRKQLKSKYKRECRKNLNLIDMAMDPKVQLPLDMSVFGELDMAAVEGTVVPLGQASVPTSDGLDSNDTSAAGVKISGQDSVTPPLQSSVDDGEPEVVVETYGEENISPATIVTQTQGSSVATASQPGEQAAIVTPASTVAKETNDDENNIPLLAMPTSTKKKARPKFRASRSKPKTKPKGKAKPKPRAVK